MINPAKPRLAPDAPLTLSFGAAHTVELSTPAVLDAFFATVSYRLEPDGWGTRFPVVLDGLNAGELRPADAPAAAAELETIAHELATLPARKAVRDYQDTRPVPPDVALLVRHDAANLRDYFVAADGLTPLATRLREAAETVQARGTAVRVSTVQARQTLKKAVGLLVIGLVIGIVAQVWFPDYFLSSHGSKAGPLIWVMGYLIAGFGVWALVEARYQRLAVWRRTHRRIALVGIVLVCGVTVYQSWRSEREPDLPRVTPRTFRPPTNR